MLDRIRKLLAADETRLDLIREALERELERRAGLKKPRRS
jgi:hypothetical protein